MQRISKDCKQLLKNVKIIKIRLSIYVYYYKLPSDLYIITFNQDCVDNINKRFKIHDTLKKLLKNGIWR